MEILSVNADQKLANIAAAIGRDPTSWKGWYALVITVESQNENLQQEGLFWTKSILDAYLSEQEGRVYFCADGVIHIVCKSLSKDVLKETGEQICALIYSESSVSGTFEVYDLASEGYVYAQEVVEGKNALSSFCPMGGDATIKGLTNPYFASNDSKEKHAKPAIDNDESTKVLLIEDDPVTRWMVRSALKHECHLATAATGNKAFSMYSSFQPEIVFLDINLPDKSGYEILEWIMRNDPGARVVMFSSNDHLDNISTALDDGASGFIAKPFLREDLLHYIHMHAQ